RSQGSIFGPDYVADYSGHWLGESNPFFTDTYGRSGAFFVIVDGKVEHVYWFTDLLNPWEFRQRLSELPAVPEDAKWAYLSPEIISLKFTNPGRWLERTNVAMALAKYWYGQKKDSRSVIFFMQPLGVGVPAIEQIVMDNCELTGQQNCQDAFHVEPVFLSLDLFKHMNISMENEAIIENPEVLLKLFSHNATVDIRDQNSAKTNHSSEHQEDASHLRQEF
ncbi:MAG: hypothetical protein JSS82_15805, partial [Bacteroidetes bacterium]|nr:hypothetical protein [Bacteroidota bacterium]